MRSGISRPSLRAQPGAECDYPGCFHVTRSVVRMEGGAEQDWIQVVVVTWLLRSIPEPSPQPHSRLLFPLRTALSSGYGMEQTRGCSSISNQCSAPRPSSHDPRPGSGTLLGAGNTGLDPHTPLGSGSCAARERNREASAEPLLLPTQPQWHIPSSKRCSLHCGTWAPPVPRLHSLGQERNGKGGTSTLLLAECWEEKESWKHLETSQKRVYSPPQDAESTEAVSILTEGPSAPQGAGEQRRERLESNARALPHNYGQREGERQSEALTWLVQGGTVRSQR